LNSSRSPLISKTHQPCPWNKAQGDKLVAESLSIPWNEEDCLKAVAGKPQHGTEQQH